MSTEDKTHPNDIAAERALLGGLMQAPEKMREIDLDAKDFWRDDHKSLFRLLKAMHIAGEPIDLVTVPERVHRTGQAARFGGINYVIELPEFAPSTANLDHYAGRVKTTADLRRLMVAGTALIEAASRQAGEPGDILDEFKKSTVVIGSSSTAQWMSYGEALDKAIASMEARETRGVGRTGVSTGFDNLDNFLSGLCPGKLYLLAARPAMGKTGKALQIIEGAAMDKHGRGVVGAYSMEMDSEEWAERSLTGLANVDKGAARSGHMSADEWDSILATRDRLRDLPVAFQDKPARTLADIEQSARELEARSEGGLRLLVIDYLQLMRGKGENQALLIGAISAGLKALARDLHVPVLLLSQLNRDCEKRSDKRPIMADIRDSGSVEQDCDVIMFLYRDHVYNPESADGADAEVIVRKQRNGPTGTVKEGYHEGRFFDLGDTNEAWL